MEPRSNPNSRPTVRRPSGAVVALGSDLPLSESDSFLGPPQRADEVGRLGPYRVLGVLGRGGMGTVYRAEDPRLKRQVAIKALLPELATEAKAKARFQREAQTQARVEHDHIIPIHGVEEANGVVFIVMPLLKGQTLGQALKQNRRPPVAELLRIGREMAEGLAAAHAAGLVHRDIKPGNVWLEGAKRRVKILDFGLARGPAPGAVTGGDPLTAAGAILGTPAYMSPEQARSLPGDPRSDVFSLGVVLYEMATGRKPFTGESAFDVMAAVVSHEPPPAADLAPEVPAALSELIQQMLAKDPEERPQSCEDVAEALAEIGRGVVVLPVVVAAHGPTPDAPDPWADLETTHAEPLATIERTRPAKAGRGTSPKWLWPVVGGFSAGGLVALVVLVALVLKKPNREVAEEPKPKEPVKPQIQPKPSVTAPKPDEETRPVAAPKIEPTPVVTEPKVEPKSHDRKAAEWVQSRGGSVRVRRNGAEQEVLATVPLPDGEWELIHVHIAPDPNVTNADLARFTGCKSLTAINANGTGIDDDGLKHLAVHAGLTYLDVGGTRVGDAVFELCGGFEKLVYLNVTNSAVTESAVLDFAAAHPGCRVECNDGVVDPKKVAVPPKAGAGLVFNGATSVSVPKLSFGGKLPLTVEAWLTPEAVDGDRHICLLGEPGGGLGIAKGKLGIGMYLGDGAWETDYSREALKEGKRVHVAAVVTKDQLLLFVDGKQVGRKKVNLTNLPATEAPAVIGRGTKFAGSAGYFAGTMFALRVSNTARYDEKGFKPPPVLVADAGTVALYKFDEGKGTKLTDHSTNKFHGEIVSGKWAAPKGK